MLLPLMSSKHTQHTCKQTNSFSLPTHTRLIATTIINLEELPNSKNNNDDIDALDLYASVNKDASESIVQESTSHQPLQTL